MFAKPPKTIYINLGLSCNENCIFCANSSLNKPVFKNIPLKEIKHIIRKFIEDNGEIIMLTGGEPTLRDDLDEIIAYAEQFDKLKSISILTNAVRLSDKNYLSKLLKADKKNIINFSVSLHSHKEKISELLTISTGTFQKTIEGINNLLKYQQHFSIYQVITSYNYKDLSKFCEFIHKKFPSLKKIVFAYPFPYGKALINNDIYVRFGLLKPFFLKALKFLEKHKYTITIANCGQVPPCVLPSFEEKVVDPRVFNYEHVIGTIGYKRFVKYEYTNDEWVKNLKNKPKKCSQCIFNTICQGLFKKYIELFNFRGIHPVRINTFKGHKIKINLQERKNIEQIIQKLISNKLNLIILKTYREEYLKDLINRIRSQNLLTIIYYKDRGIIYP